MCPDDVTPAMLCSLPIFSGLSDNHVDVIAGISKIQPFQENQEIFHEGDTRDSLYVVLDGRVALEMHIPNQGRLRILTVEPPDAFGWSSVADTAPRRTVTARAVCDGRFLVINAAKLRHACQKDPVLGHAVMQHVANLIASRLMVTRLQLLDMFSQPSSEAPHG